MNGCIVSTVATDALVLKHQAISFHSAGWTFIVLNQFHIKKILAHKGEQHQKMKSHFDKNDPVILWLNINYLDYAVILN